MERQKLSLDETSELQPAHDMSGLLIKVSEAQMVRIAFHGTRHSVFIGASSPREKETLQPAIKGRRLMTTVSDFVLNYHESQIGSSICNIRWKGRALLADAFSPVSSAAAYRH